jgi:hypothetical protein
MDALWVYHICRQCLEWLDLVTLSLRKSAESADLSAESSEKSAESLVQDDDRLFDRHKPILICMLRKCSKIQSLEGK